MDISKLDKKTQNYIKEELDEHHVSASLLSMKEISSASLNSDTKEHFDSMLVSLNYVVLMVILLAAALDLLYWSIFSCL